jgi:signal peptidase I
MSRTSRLREVVLTVGAIGGALCFAAGIATFAFGVTPLIVESGSMSPTIKTGALAIAHDVPAASLHVGDIVRVKTAPKASVTHRIVKITHRPGSATLRLKGDANKVPDAQLYTVATAGEVLFSIPFLGRVVAAASGPIGLFLLGGYVAFAAMVVIEERRTRRPTDRGSGSGTGGRRGGSRKADKQNGRRGSLKATVTVTALFLGGAATVGAAPQPTYAAWTDSVNVGTSTLSTYTVPIPQNFRCGALGLLSVQFQWDAVAGATNYTLHFGSGGASTMTVSGTSQTITAAIAGGTAWVNANRNFGSTTWTSANSNTRSYTVAVVSLCS